MELDDALDQRQADAAAPGRAEALEELEDLVVIRGGDAGAVVAHEERRRGAGRRSTHLA